MIAARLARALFVVACFVASSVAVGAEVVELQVYGYGSDAPVKTLIAKLAALAPTARVVFRDLALGGNGVRFSQLLDAINTEANIPFLPDSVERRAAPPYYHIHNQNRYYAAYESSLTGIYVGGALVGIAMGDGWYQGDFWGDLVRDAPGWDPAVCRVWVPSGTYQIADRAIVDELSALFLGDR
jgi:hypothetical protein